MNRRYVRFDISRFLAAEFPSALGRCQSHPGYRVRFRLKLHTIALVACSDAPRCKPIEHCDVRTKRCQRAALEHAICLRGRGEPPDLDVPVVTLAQEQFLEETRQAAQDDSEATRQMRSALSHFDLVAPPSEDEDVRVARARRVAGLYDSQERRITLIEDGSPWDSSDNVLTLVHEMVHALQDAAGELSPQPRVSSFDQALVRSALAEGEATLLVDEAAAEGFGFAFGELDYARALASYRRSSFSWVARSESPFDVAGSGFAYAFGASYLWPLRRDRGAPAIAEAQEQRPVSAYAIMNRDPEDHALRENDLGESAAPVLPELTRVGCYRLGRFVYEAWRDAADRRSLPEGTNFVADALCVFVDPEALDAEASVRATWRVRFSSEAAAAQAHRSTAGRSGTQSEGADVWWTRGRFDAPLPPFQEWEAAPAQDFGFEREQPAAGRIECLRRRLRAGALD